jgi:flagellar biogenesis protein FliO
MIFYLFIFILNLLIVVVNWILKILVKNKEKKRENQLKNLRGSTVYLYTFIGASGENLFPVLL